MFEFAYVYPGVWFQIFFNVHPEIWGNDPIWLIFFKLVGSTTNQYVCLSLCMSISLETLNHNTSIQQVALQQACALAEAGHESPKWRVPTFLEWVVISQPPLGLKQVNYSDLQFILKWCFIMLGYLCHKKDLKFECIWCLWLWKNVYLYICIYNCFSSFEMIGPGLTYVNWQIWCTPLLNYCT